MKFLRFITAAVMALSMVACGEPTEEETPGGKSPFKVQVNSNVIRLGVDNAYFLVYIDNVLAEYDEITVFDYKTNDIIPTTPLEVELDGTTVTVPEWTPSEIGTRTFWVSYKSYHNQNAPVGFTVVDFDFPDRVEDPQPENLNFTKRVFVNKFTGVGCQYCPYATAALHAAAETMGDKFITAEIHTYPQDPYSPTNYANIETFFGVRDYPTVFFDMSLSLKIGKDMPTNESRFKTAIERCYEIPANAGIAANIASDSGDTFIARVSVKAAVDGEYSVGAWLVEDNIRHSQANGGCTADIDFTQHNAVLRVADSKPIGSESYFGYPLGEMKAGEIKDQLFTISVDEPNQQKNDWIKENCRLILFVTTVQDGRTVVTNCIGNDLYTESIPYDYIEE